MRVIGMLHGHNSSAALIDAEGMRGSVSEERYDRKKNSTAFPKGSINYLLNISGVKTEELDLVVSASKCVPFIDDHQIKAYEEERVNNFSSLSGRIKETIHILYYRFPIFRSAIKALYHSSNNRWKTEESAQKIRKHIQNFLPVDSNKIIFADHHTCHAYSVYYGFVPKEVRSEPFLVLTLDGEGDGLCSSINVVRNDNWEKISETKAGNSIASFYGAITKFLGMTVNEHEYKVMGLAPYCSDYNRDKTLKKFQGLFWVNDDLTFGSQGGGNFVSMWLEDNLKYDRFDAVAAAAQKYVEDLAIEWIQKAIEKTGIHNIALSGGFFMNIKVNKVISELPEVKRLYVCPSGGDESAPIGAVYYGLKTLGANLESGLGFIPNLYLGNEYTESEIEEAIKLNCDHKTVSVTKSDDIEMAMAKLLAAGEIVSRLNGRMEFGARALGNRSILANPSSPDVVKTINEQIKNRDFWMPFACSILEERAADYLLNPKGIDLSFMAISCETTALARKHLIGAIHPYDYTARPQVVRQADNPSYHKMLKYFDSLTQIGGVLNTSMNLHGEPLVNTPADAISTFSRSGLKHLAIGNYLLSKVS